MTHNVCAASLFIVSMRMTMMTMTTESRGIVCRHTQNCTCYFHWISSRNGDSFDRLLLSHVRARNCKRTAEHSFRAHQRTSEPTERKQLLKFEWKERERKATKKSSKTVYKSPVSCCRVNSIRWKRWHIYQSFHRHRAKLLMQFKRRQ